MLHYRDTPQVLLHAILAGREKNADCSEYVELPRPTRQSLPLQRRREHLAIRRQRTQHDDGPAHRAGYHVPAVQGDGGVEVRQGVRADGEVQGRQIHTRGGVAVYGVLDRLRGGFAPEEQRVMREGMIDVRGIGKACIGRDGCWFFGRSMMSIRSMVFGNVRTIII